MKNYILLGIISCFGFAVGLSIASVKIKRLERKLKDIKEELRTMLEGDDIK